MLCPSCQLESRDGSRFCLGCGTPLVRPCPSCERELPADAAFCDGCGTAVGARAEPRVEPDNADAPRDRRAYTPKHLAERILTSRSALEGERKHVTVLFADLPDSVPLAERIGPDEMHVLMDRCIEQILDQVHRYEGFVNQFTGDGAMALFGAPLALEDAPRRAVQAALGIQRALESVAEEVRSRHGAELRMRIGIHTGPVVVGKIGDDLRMDYTAVGDTTNLANRLQGLARPGSIVISQATESQVRGFFEIRDLGLMEVKGKSEPVQVYEALEELAVSGRLDAVAPAELTPYVGREREIDALRAAFEDARAGRGQVAFVVGEAGLGKSRMLHEFRRRLQDVPHVWIEGRCAELARTTPFGAIVDALRRSFGIEDRDNDTTALLKIQSAQETLGADLDWTLPFLRQLLSLPVDDRAVEEMEASARRSETFRALQAHFVRASEQAPLVLVVEDLHWIDAASQDFLGYLSDSIPASRALLVFTHRTGYQHPFGDRSYHVRISLQALSGAEMESMAGSVLETGALPEELLEIIAEKAEGNPFFVEEVTKSLLEQGVLQLRDGVFELATELEAVGVPDRIQDVLMARLDRLADEPKRAIQLASVIGRDFALRLLERISEVGDRIGALVEELRALELIQQKAAHPELAFHFKHALTHDVAYDSIVLPRRRTLHAIAGAAIEELYRDRLAEHYEQLAYHFTEGEEWERALEYHQRAGEKASEAYANQSAVEHCRQALAMADRLGDSVPDERRRHLAELLAFAHWCMSEFRESADAYARASSWSGEVEARAMNLARASHSYLWAHSYDRSEQCARETQALSREHDLPGPEGLACFVQAQSAYYLQGDIDLGATASAEGMQLSERAGNEEAEGLGRYNLGFAAEWTGDYRQAIVQCERAIDIGQRLRLPHLVIWPAWFIGKASCCLGDYGRAIARLQDALDHAERIGDRAWRSRVLNTLGWCFAEFGSHERARVYNERAVSVAREIGDPEIMSNGQINLGVNHLALGDRDAALEQLAPIAATLDQPGDPWMRWRYTLHARDGLARVALAGRDPERALALTQRELEDARKHVAPKLEARAIEMRGRVLVSLDRRPEAEQALQSALEIAGRIEYPPVVWRSRSLLGELARRRGDRSEAEAQAAQARALVEGLARQLPDAELQKGFGALGEQLVVDPLGAYR